MAIEVGHNVVIPPNVSPSAVTATGSTTARTLANRFADVVNVKDFGATGNGVTDDTGAIQAAVNAGVSLFFPVGTYLLTSGIVLPTSAPLLLRGSGKGSYLTGSVPGGFLIDKPSSGSIVEGVWGIEDLRVKNTSTTSGSGAIRLLGVIAANLNRIRVDGVNAAGTYGLFLVGNTFTVSVTNSRFLGVGAQGIGILTGGHAEIHNVDIVGWADGVRAFGPTVNVSGNRLEVNGKALNLGTDDTGATTPLTSSSIVGNKFEANDTDVYANDVDSSLISGLSTQGSVNSPSGQSVYGIRLRTVSRTVVSAIGVGGSYSSAAISIEANGVSNVLAGVSASNTFTGAPPWSIPSSLTGYTFLETNLVTPSMASDSFDAPAVGGTARLGAANASNVELGRGGQNMIAQSQAIATLPWTPTGSGAAAPTVTNNTADVLAPDGTATATKIEIPAVSGGTNRSYTQNSFLASVAPYTFSVWLQVASGTASTYISATPNGVTYITQPCFVTTTWTRFYATGTLTASSWFPQIGTDLRNVAESATSAVTIYAWGAQIEPGSTPGTYVPTVAAPVIPSVRFLAPAQINRGISRGGWTASADRGDTSQTITVGTDAPIQHWATALGANRTVTLSTTGAVNGDAFRIVRTGLGAFTLDVGGLKTIPSATAAFVDVSYNGSAWILTGYGTL